MAANLHGKTSRSIAIKLYESIAIPREVRSSPCKTIQSRKMGSDYSLVLWVAQGCEKTSRREVDIDKRAAEALTL